MADFRFAILGLGSIARKMAETVQKMEGVQLYAVAARDAARAQAFAQEFGAQVAYGSYEELVQDDKVELVYVATPHSHHMQHAMLCLRHARPVLCEKAFTANAAQAKQLIRFAQEHQVFLQEAMWTRFLPIMQTIRTLATDGSIGDCAMLEASFGFYGVSVPRMAQPELAGGALLDLGVYPLTLASMVLGDDIANIATNAHLLPSGVDGASSTSLYYKSGQLAVINCSMLNAFPPAWWVYGSKGMLRMDSLFNPSCVHVLDKDGNELSTHKAPAQLTGYEYEVAASITAIRDGRLECPEMPHSQTLRMMELMDSLRASWGQRYPWDEA